MVERTAPKSASDGATTTGGRSRSRCRERQLDRGRADCNRRTMPQAAPAHQGDRTGRPLVTRHSLFHLPGMFSLTLERATACTRQSRTRPTFSNSRCVCSVHACKSPEIVLTRARIQQPEKETYQTTRKHAADYMRTHPDDFLPFLPSEEDPENMMGPGKSVRALLRQSGKSSLTLTVRQTSSAGIATRSKRRRNGVASPRCVDLSPFSVTAASLTGARRYRSVPSRCTTKHLSL